MSLLSLRLLLPSLFSPPWLLAIGVLLITFVYIFAFKNWWYFSGRKVPFSRGWPLLGSIYKMIIGQESFAMTIHRLYNEFPNERFFGAFEMTQPVFIIRDPELIKECTIQHFDHFSNHQGDIHDPILARSLFFLKDQKWKDMRATLSPAFTGNKLRLMFELIKESTDEFMQQLGQRNHTNGVVYELKDTFTRYTSDIIANCAFGLKVNSIANRDNEFYLAGKKITNFDGIQGIKFLLYDCIPTLMKLCRIQLIDEVTVDYFRNVIRKTIERREKNNIFQPDMINLLMEARQKANLTANESPPSPLFAGETQTSKNKSSIGKKKCNFNVRISGF